MQSAKDQEKSLELYFWQFLLRYLSKKELLDQTVKKVWPLLTAEQLLGMESFAESNESVSATCLWRPPKFNEFESWLTKVSIQDIQYSFGKRLLIYCVFRIGLKVAIELVFPSNGKGVSEKKTQSVPYADWGPRLVPLMVEALAGAPNQDPIQTLRSLATQQVKKLKAVAVTTPTPSASSSTTTTTISTSLPVAPLEKTEEKKETKPIQATTLATTTTTTTLPIAPLEKKEGKPIQVTTFESGPLIDAMNQPVVEKHSQSVSFQPLDDKQKAQRVDQFIEQFWRDVGVAGDEMVRLQFSDKEAPWLRPIVEKMFGSVDQTALTRQTALFDKLNFLRQHVRQAYSDDEITLIDNVEKRHKIIPAAQADEPHKIRIRYAYEHYRRQESSDRRAFSAPIKVVADIIICENPIPKDGAGLALEDFFQEKIISVSLSKEDAELLRLQEYLRDWFEQELQRHVAEAERLEKLFNDDAEKLFPPAIPLTAAPPDPPTWNFEDLFAPPPDVPLTTPPKVPRLVRGSQKKNSVGRQTNVSDALLHSYTGGTSYLTALAKLTRATGKYAANSPLKKRIEKLHDLYRANYQRCLHLQAMREPAIGRKQLLHAQIPLKLNQPATLTLKKTDFTPEWLALLAEEEGAETVPESAAGLERISRLVIQHLSERFAIQESTKEEGKEHKEIFSSEKLQHILGEKVFQHLFMYEMSGKGTMQDQLLTHSRFLQRLFRNPRNVALKMNRLYNSLHTTDNTITLTKNYEHFIPLGQALGRSENGAGRSHADGFSLYAPIRHAMQFQFPSTGRDLRPTVDFTLNVSVVDAHYLGIAPLLAPNSPAKALLISYEQQLFTLPAKIFKPLVIKDDTVEHKKLMEVFPKEFFNDIQMHLHHYEALQPVRSCVDQLFTWWPVQMQQYSAKINRIFFVVQEDPLGGAETILNIEYILVQADWPVTVRFNIARPDAPVALDVSMHSAQVLQLKLAEKEEVKQLIPVVMQAEAQQELLFWYAMQCHLGTAYTRAQVLTQVSGAITSSDEVVEECVNFLKQFQGVGLTEEEELMIYGVFKISVRDVLEQSQSPSSVMPSPGFSELLAYHVIELMAKSLRNRALPVASFSSSSQTTHTAQTSVPRTQVHNAPSLPVDMVHCILELANRRVRRLQQVLDMAAPKPPKPSVMPALIRNGALMAEQKRAEAKTTASVQNIVSQTPAAPAGGGLKLFAHQPPPLVQPTQSPLLEGMPTPQLTLNGTNGNS